MQKQNEQLRENPRSRGRAFFTVMSVIGLSLLIPLVSALLMNAVFSVLVETQIPAFTRGLLSLFAWIAGFTLGTMAFWRLAQSMSYNGGQAR